MKDEKEQKSRSSKTFLALFSLPFFIFIHPSSFIIHPLILE
jgi:hypothetical protein